jgi:hypothetical protein
VLCDVQLPKIRQGWQCRDEMKWGPRTKTLVGLGKRVSRPASLTSHHSSLTLNTYYGELIMKECK